MVSRRKTKKPTGIDALAKKLLEAVKRCNLGRYRMRFCVGGTVIVNADTKPFKLKRGA